MYIFYQVRSTGYFICATWSLKCLEKKPIVASTHLHTTGKLIDSEMLTVLGPSPNTSLFHCFATSATPNTLTYKNLAAAETPGNK